MYEVYMGMSVWPVLVARRRREIVTGQWQIRKVFAHLTGTVYRAELQRDMQLH